MSNIYTITGATGNIGHVIVEKLLELGHEVRAVARNTLKFQPLGRRGAELFSGSLDNLDHLTAAYKGADAVFAMIPPNLQSEDYLAFADNICKTHVDAIQKAGVKNVVALSSIGTHLSDGADGYLGKCRGASKQSCRGYQYWKGAGSLQADAGKLHPHVDRVVRQECCKHV